ncbi:hypothetical protein CON48_08705 [Bacillus thuringiensis]|uniref:Uncharacterized protein n=1 Tax=Bacillus thuringiensis TaxID=1428 RepID=A0A9X6XQM9_BACTU|nr:hypothetical protein SD98_06470 [Bacillus thuringiensis serovar morrisoni]AND23149.1 hypothetical protein ATN07_06125 [Bacillus thuringiensis serovar israelensis]AQY37627.1 hypothetical protein B4918_06255 [Bacillus thuringiensis]MBR9660650.1 hypothetical protein [Bacillus cereus]OTX76067.1 hypothetical protein BK719_07695 [Bacillus thuringiensis serovar novosibirsk]OTY35993.1 hypothetical protein BK736_21155 [Bacillus thuringiensis serovar poloniensis]OTY36216.1 hypothetical protein BK745
MEVSLYIHLTSRSTMVSTISRWKLRKVNIFLESSNNVSFIMYKM